LNLKRNKSGENYKYITAEDSFRSRETALLSKSLGIQKGFLKKHLVNVSTIQEKKPKIAFE